MSSRPGAEKHWLYRFSAECTERKQESTKLVDQQRRDEAHARLASSGRAKDAGVSRGVSLR